MNYKEDSFDMLGPDADAIADFLEDTSNVKQPKSFFVRTETPVGHIQVQEYLVTAVDEKEAIEKATHCWYTEDGHVEHLSDDVIITSRCRQELKVINETITDVEEV